MSQYLHYVVMQLQQVHECPRIYVNWQNGAVGATCSFHSQSKNVPRKKKSHVTS